MYYRRCRRCRGPISSKSKTGFCCRNFECRRLAHNAQRRAYYFRTQPDRPECELCGLPMRRTNRYGVCARRGPCREEYQRRWLRAHPERVAQWRSRTKIYLKTYRAALVAAGLTTHGRRRLRMVS